jgi:hypothetical protein
MPNPSPPPSTTSARPGADLGIVSILPSETTAKVGDYVTFTIVAENFGPGPEELFVNTLKSSEGLMSGGLMPGDPSSTNCGVVNGPAPQPGTHGNDGSWCEDGLTQPGDTVTDTVIMQIAPTSTGQASATACATSPDDPVGYADPTNGCKTATVQVSSTTCNTGVPGATQTLGNVAYNLEGEDTFTKAAPLGSFAQSPAGIPDGNSLPVVYTGDHGMGWTEYPDGWPSDWSIHGYSPSTVQSVHDGVLDFYLHGNSSGQPVGASISPLPGGNRYQTYGAWSFCELVAPTDYFNLADFHQAPLLWPYSDTDQSAAESDFPEGDLWATAAADPSNQFSAFAHHAAPGVQDQFHFAAADASFSPYQWHVYTQVWGPGYRSYYVDGQLVGTSTTSVYGQPERWQLQVEPANPADAPHSPFGSGHIYVKWVWIGTPGS